MRTAVFVGATLVLAWVSRGSLLRPRSHGFFRFLAGEGLGGLILINAPLWFQNSWVWHQLISWFLLIASLVPLTLGVRSLRSLGRPDPRQRLDAGLFAFERTTQLVQSGVYEYIRHPMYASLLLLNWGVFFKDPSLLGGVIAGAVTCCLLMTARMDEAECLQAFGKGYQMYMRHTKMFVPFLL